MTMDTRRLLEQAFALQKQGRLSEAEALCRQLLAAAPELFHAHHLLGSVMARQGRMSEALDSYARALALDPRNAGLLNNRANLKRKLGRFDEALADYDASLALQPGQAMALANRGHLLLGDLGRPEEAAASFAAALNLDPNLKAAADGLVSAQNYLAAQFLQSHQAGAALAAADAALARAPSNADAHNCRGGALLALKRYGEALDSFDAALAAEPGHRGALNNRGLAFLDMNHLEEAIVAFDLLLAIDPIDSHALYNRATALALLNRHQEAVRDLDALLAADPAHPSAFGALAGSILQLCDWPRREAIAAALPERIAGRGDIIPAVTLLGYGDDPVLLRRNAENITRQAFGAEPPAQAPAPLPHTRIRIAYLSADFRPHPVANQIVNLIEMHDRAKFEVIGVALGEDEGSSIRARLEKAFDIFRNASLMDDAAVAQLLRDMQVDIAVDLQGHTVGNRPGIFARRPAPVQVNYLGYPGTTGASFMDYVIADPQTAPFEHQPWFSERIVQLPFSYMPSDATRPAVARPVDRAKAGLPAQGFVFCCFNNGWKITPQLFDIWMRLLALVPGSLLWLRQDHEATRQTFMAQALARGIDPARLIFAPRVATEEDHIARLACADLFLDTLPYNAHATACDTLWAGVPVLTCRGGTFAGRVGAGLLDAIGLPELITDDLDAYQALALALAQDPAGLSVLKQRLAENRASQALFDMDRFRGYLETAFFTMLQTARAGEPPRAFSVPSS